MKLIELLRGTYAEVINSMLPFSKLKSYDYVLVRIHINNFTIEYAVWKSCRGFSFYEFDLAKININGMCIEDMVVKEWKVLDENGVRIKEYNGVLDIVLNDGK